MKTTRYSPPLPLGKAFARFAAAVRAVLLLCAVAALTGCSSNLKPLPKPSRAEWLDKTARVYEGVGEEELFSAAERVLLHASGGWKITNWPGKMSAVRDCSAPAAAVSLIRFAMLSPVDFECEVEFTVEKIGGGKLKTHAEFASNHEVHGVMGVLHSGSGRSVERGQYWVHNLFYSRLDYMLGRKKQWLTCAGSIRQLRSKYGEYIGWGLSPLCHIANDSSPSPPKPSAEPSVLE